MAFIVYVEEMLLHSSLLYLPLYVVTGIAIFLLMIRGTSAFSEGDKDLFTLFMPLKSRTLMKLIRSL